MQQQRHYIPITQLQKRAKARAARPRVALGSHELTTPLPAKHSLRPHVYYIYDQGQLGSCTANAFCGAYRILSKDKSFHPSRLWFYFQERLLEDPDHKVSDLTDSGADVVDGESYVQVHGICSEHSWPYDISKYNVPPPAAAYKDAAKHKISSHSVVGAGDIKKFIAAGTPVLLAIAVYDSFESQDVASTGQVPMPDTNTEQCLGGHETLIVGYDDATQTYEVQNSWGADWGDKGFFHLPYDYVHDPKLCMELSVFKI